MKSARQQDPRYEHHLLEALWVYQHHNQVNRPLLERVLASTDFHARAAAARVLCYWRDRVSDALERVQAPGGRSASARAAWKRCARPASSPCPRRSRSP